jgi:hypothetical protein
MDCAPQVDDVYATRHRSSKVRPNGVGNVRKSHRAFARSFSENGN